MQSRSRSKPDACMHGLLSGAGLLSAALLLLNAGGAVGQDYPNRPIRILAAGVGSGGDFDARQIATGIGGAMGQPLIVDNRGNGALAADAASKAAPDGYTLLIAGGTLWVTPLLQKTSYDMANDFAPISLIERTVFIVAVHPSVPARSVRELIALAHARPGELNYGSGGVGSAIHLSGELFKSMAAINIVSVPYKGNGPVITALVSGEIQIAIIDSGLLMPYIKSGRLRALAVTSSEPSALAPGLPVVAASGVPGYTAGGMTSMWAPAKTPAAIIARLNQEIVRFLGRPDVKERFLTAGVEVIASSPEQLWTTMKSEVAVMGKVIRSAGIKVD